MDVERSVIGCGCCDVTVVDRIRFSSGGVVDIVGVVPCFTTDEAEVFQGPRTGCITAVGANILDVGVIKNVIGCSSIKANDGFLAGAGFFDCVSISNPRRVVRNV